jgi:hypothetical protein
MTTRTTFSPPFAPRIWTDGRYIFAEFPAIKDKDSFITKYELTAEGLQKVLTLIPTVAGRPGYITGNANIADKILTSAPAKVSSHDERKRHLKTIPTSVKEAAARLVKGLKED